MEMIYHKLSEEKEKGGTVKGALSNVLLAWCTLAIAFSKGEFKVVDGLPDYDLTPPETEDLLPFEPGYTVDENGCAVSNGWIIGYQGESKELQIDSRYAGIVESAHFCEVENWSELYISTLGDLRKIEFVEVPSAMSAFHICGDCIESIVFCHGIKEIPYVVFPYGSSFDSLKELILPDDVEIVHLPGKVNNKVPLLIPASVKDLSWPDEHFDISAYQGSYAAEYLTSKNIPFAKLKTPEQIEQEKREAEARERERQLARQREAERLERIRKLAEEKRKAEEAAKLAKQQEEARLAAIRKSKYDALLKEKETLLQTIADNSGLFGQKARTRKEAKARLQEVEAKLKLYPEFSEQ